MNFWDTLVSSGAQLASKIVAPLGAGIGQSVSNLVQTGQNKVSQLSSSIVQTTSPNTATGNKPSVPPTTAAKPVSSVNALIQANLGIFAVIAVIILVLYMRGKK